MNSFLRNTAFTALLISVLSGSENTQSSKKYQSDAESSMMSFVLLNHSRLVHEIELGRGEYVESLITQKQNAKMDFTVLRILESTNQDTYKFAKAVVEYH